MWLKEAGPVIRKLKDNVQICGDAEVFEQEPLDAKSEIDDHVIYIRNVPSGQGAGQAFVEINHSRKLCHLFDADKWAFPQYATFGTFTDRDRFLVQMLLCSCDTNNVMAMAKLCENTDNGVSHVVIAESSRENRPVLEFGFFMRQEAASAATLVSKWGVDKSDMRVVYESAQYTDGALIDSSIAEGFQGVAEFKYPSKVTVYESKHGSSSRTTEYEILGVSTNDLSVEMTLYALLRRSMGKVSGP